MRFVKQVKTQNSHIYVQSPLEKNTLQKKNYKLDRTHMNTTRATIYFIQYRR